LWGGYVPERNVVRKAKFKSGREGIVRNELSRKRWRKALKPNRLVGKFSGMVIESELERGEKWAVSTGYLIASFCKKKLT